MNDLLRSFDFTRAFVAALILFIGYFIFAYVVIPALVYLLYISLASVIPALISDAIGYILSFLIPIGILTLSVCIYFFQKEISWMEGALLGISFVLFLDVFSWLVFHISKSYELGPFGIRDTLIVIVSTVILAQIIGYFRKARSN